MSQFEDLEQQMEEYTSQRLATGIAGLDEILNGGLVAHQAYLLHGRPGTGKTALGLHFLATGVKKGERTLFLTMGEPADQIKMNAISMGFDVSGIQFLDLAPSPDFFSRVQAYDIFSPADVEREPTTERITSEIETYNPTRIFVDAITHFRYLSNDTTQFRRQVHSFLRFLIEKGATVVFTSEYSASEPDDDLQYMCDGIIHLDYIDDLRTVSVMKMRGSDFMSGNHSMRLSRKGMEVFPRLSPAAGSLQAFRTEVISSGIPEMDELMHGGLERGTIIIISGPSGVGKTTLGVQFMKEAAERGERSVIYTFEEWKDMLVRRSEGVNIPVKAMIERGTLSIVEVAPLRFTPDEFARLVRNDVEENGASIVMIDSVSGYRLSVRGEGLVRSIHTLSKYLQSVGVTVVLINEIEEVTGQFRATEVGISYIADTIIFLRYLEFRGELRRALGVLKKRLSNFEKTLREFEITGDGIKVGRPLTDLRGILTGMPDWREDRPNSPDNH